MEKDIVKVFNEMREAEYNTLEEIFKDGYTSLEILNNWLKYEGIIGYTGEIKLVINILQSTERKIQKYRKVTVTDGMSNDRIIFVTDSSDDDLKIWQKFCKMEKQNGESYDFLKILEQKHYVKRLFDSEVDPPIIAETIEWDIQMDWND